MNGISSNVSAKIANASFVCACLIVMHHIPVGESGSGLYGVLLGLRPVSNVAVPFFFLASGFLLMGHSDEPGWWGRALRRRVRTLLDPYLVVNAIYFPFMWLYHNMPGAAFHSEMAYDFSLVNILAAFGLVLPRNPACGPLWYVRMLMVLVVVSPVIACVVRKSRAWALLCAVLAALNYFFEPFGIKDEVFGSRGLFFFVSGICLRLHGLPDVGRVAAALSGVVCCACAWTLHAVELPHVARCAIVYALPISGVVALWGLVPGRKWPAWLTSCSFAVYCFHMLVIFGCKAASKAAHCYDLLLTPVGFFACILLPVAACCAFYNFVSRRMPSMASLLFGGR